MLKSQKISALVKKPLDRSVVQQLEKAGSVLDYVSGQTIMDILTQAFGPTWSVQYPEHWVDKFDSIETKKGTYTPAYVITVKAVITVPMLDPETNQQITVVREGFGTAVMKSKFEEMVLKTAQTDALKKAAYSFGIAGELFRNAAEQAWYVNLTAPWNAETLIAYQKEWDFIRNYITKNQLTKNQLSQMVCRMTNGEETELTPDNIRQLVDVLAGKAA